jgi:hypothetical protein
MQQISEPTASCPLISAKKPGVVAGFHVQASSASMAPGGDD